MSTEINRDCDFPLCEIPLLFHPSSFMLFSPLPLWFLFTSIRKPDRRGMMVEEVQHGASLTRFPD